jgi:hypothetical protein
MAIPSETLQIDTWDMTGVFVEGATLTWSLTIGSALYSGEVVMTTDLETTGALLVTDINGTMPNDTVLATFDTDTLTLTSEFLGLRFYENFGAPDGVPTFPTTANLGAINSNGDGVMPELIATVDRASQQPASGWTLQVLPEGERSGDIQVFLTYLPLRPTDQHGQYPADIVENYEGIRFKVIKVAETRAVIPHFSAIAARIPESLPAATVPSAPAEA